MNLINTITLEYPRSLWQLRLENPNVSFPAEPTDDDLAPFDHANVHPTPPPECDPRTERAEDSLQPQQADDGTWQQVWCCRAATAEEIAAWDAAQLPAPDWRTFKQVALSSGTLNEIQKAAAEACPLAAASLAATLLRADQGDHSDFADVWARIVHSVDVPGRAIEQFQSVATDCHLPAAFVAALDPRPV
jgi:hypothetical protein